MDSNDGGKGSVDKKNNSFRYLQYLRLFVSTQIGLKFIVCVDRSAKGQELEFQISETYEQLKNNSPEDNNEEVKLRAYRTKNIKHHGYQLAIPRNMTVGHFLEDKAEIECEIEPNTHKELKINVKVEEQKKSIESNNHRSQEPNQKKKSKLNRQVQEEDQEVEVPQQVTQVSNNSQDTSLEAKQDNNKQRNINQNLKTQADQKNDNNPRLPNVTRVSKPYFDNSSQRSLQNESARQTPKQLQPVEPHIDVEAVESLRIVSPNNAQPKSKPNGQQVQLNKLQLPPQYQNQKVQTPQPQVQGKGQSNGQLKQQQPQVQTKNQIPQTLVQPQMSDDNQKKTQKKTQQTQGGLIRSNLIQLPGPKENILQESQLISTNQNAQKKKQKQASKVHFMIHQYSQLTIFKVDEVNISSSDDIPQKPQKIVKQVKKKEKIQQSQTLNYDKNLFADL